jgi:hypothetical protein
MYTVFKGRVFLNPGGLFWFCGIVTVASLTCEELF